MNNYRILFLTHKISIGGASKMLVNLANYLAKTNKYEIHLLTYSDLKIDWELNRDIVLHDFLLPKGKSTYHPTQLMRLRKKINEISPDLLISFLVTPNICSVFSSIGTNTKVILSERGDPYEHKKNSKYSILEKFFYNFAHGIVFQTDGAKKFYNKRIQAKSIIIPNPIDVSELPEYWNKERENVIVNVANFKLVHKRQDLLIDAFSQVQSDFPDTSLVLYGDGEDKAQIIKIIKERKLQDRVFLAGKTKNVLEMIQKAKVFVLSSDSEGLPNALIEAMSLGLPVISTDCSPGGAAYLISNYKNGILVPRGNAKELSTAINFMLSNQEYAKNMGIEALKISSKLQPDHIYATWEKFIHRVVEEGIPNG